jgi:pyrroloquinoline quinone biosynthesis protein E
MEPPRYELSALIALRVYDDRAVAVDHATGEILELNAAAGRLLERLGHGQQTADPDDLEFLAEAAHRGLVRRAPTAASRAEAAATTSPPDDAGVDLLEEINRWAVAAVVPLHCQLELTYRCPLACRHCYLEGTPTAAARELDTDEIRDFLAQLAELGGLFLLLTGGEPFSRADLEQIVDHARDLRFAVSLLTSGTGANPARIERLARRGLDAVQVSLHGPDAATHDALTRVPGSFDAALTCLRAFRDRGVQTRAAVTLTRENVDAAPRIRELLDRERVDAALNLYLEPRRNGARDPQALAADEAALGRALAVFPLPEEHRMGRVGPDDPLCGAGVNTLALDPFGTVRPCLPLRLNAGSIREQPLERIWRESTALEQVRGLRLHDLEGCPSCAHRDSCDRCTAFAVAEGRPLSGHSDFDCVQARLYESLRGQRRDS